MPAAVREVSTLSRSVRCRKTWQTGGRFAPGGANSPSVMPPGSSFQMTTPNGFVYSAVAGAGVFAVNVAQATARTAGSVIGFGYFATNSLLVDCHERRARLEVARGGRRCCASHLRSDRDAALDSAIPASPCGHVAGVPRSHIQSAPLLVDGVPLAWPPGVRTRVARGDDNDLIRAKRATHASLARAAAVHNARRRRHDHASEADSIGASRLLRGSGSMESRTPSSAMTR